MKIQMAPMEGITTYIYRNAHAAHFGKMDKYYTPFLSLHKEKEFNHKELQEILPKHNDGLNVIPQVLTNSAEDFLVAAEKLKDMGYDEININLGCPSGTVTAKNKGAGMLQDTVRLDQFLTEVFAKSPVDVSIKTRIGMESADEWESLLEIYNKYPIKELIIHARVREDYYKNTPNLEAYVYAVKNSKNPICYNGDIFSVEDYQRLKEILPDDGNIMLGRGLIARPFLTEELYHGTKQNIQEKETRMKLQAFHDEVYEGYKQVMSGDMNVLFKMKEL
ncbi:MAG: tRNA-dihydrouridine synthase family protein, partial [Lachnospiraceae bacterium]|nr:tRNA-dihydrouridine synthase family protein [Lachnospiraceae bacterium]